MELFIKFLLTRWAGAPLAIWLFGELMAIVIFIAWRANRIKFKPFRGEIEIENMPPTKEKAKAKHFPKIISQNQSSSMQPHIKTAAPAFDIGLVPRLRRD